MSDSFVIGGPLRAGLGLLLISGSLLALWTSRTIELGIAWTTVIPALILLSPGAALLPRRVLAWRDGGLELTDGWLWRRCLRLPLAATELEVVPTAGLCAVVLHRGGTHGGTYLPGSRTLATWIRPRTALSLLTWLDAHHPERAFPRRSPLLPISDR